MFSRFMIRPAFTAAVLIFAGYAAGVAHAATITGTVRNEAGTGLSNVDLDFIDLCGGDNIFLSGDKTAADGTFSVVVPNGTYDLHFTPPAGSTVCADDHQGLVVNANAALGIVTLHPGRLVTGVVQTPSFGPASGVDLKFVNAATEDRVYLTKDVTNASGQYSVRVPPGTWSVDYRPPAGTSYTNAERMGLVVAGADISGLVNVLGSGFTISGTIQDRNNVKIKNADIDVYDSCTGLRVPTAHDNTDANGNYAVCVPPGSYTFNYSPPRCKGLASLRSTGMVVDRNRNIGTDRLDPAVLVSGIVHDDVGLPMAGAKIKFYDVSTAGAPRQATTDDRTDASGNFSVYVPTSTYDIDVEPPVGVNNVPVELNNAIVGGAANVGTIQTAAGVAVSGHVTGPGGVPALNVNINAVDAATRTAQRLAHDDTDAAGNFTVVMAPGTYDFQYDPPACSGLAPTSRNGVVIGGTTTIPTASLVTGVHLTGSVVSGPLPVPNVDLDVYPAGSVTKLYTPNDQSAADGTFDVLLPPGTYDVRLIPSALTRLRPALRSGVAMPGSTALPAVTLVDGWLVSGLVRDESTLMPVSSVIVEFFVPGTLTPVWTTHHTTDVTGAYSVSIDAGTWDILYTGPVGSAYAPVWRHGVSVSADVPLSDQLLSTSNTGVPLPGNSPGAGLTLAVPWPNPTRDHLNLTFAAPGDGAELTALDVVGRRVATLWRGRSDTAPVTLVWNFTGDDGRPLPSGVYYVRLADRSGSTRVRRLVLAH